MDWLLVTFKARLPDGNMYPPVISSIVEIPKELLKLQENITLSMDGLSVNSLKFLTTISHDIMYRIAQYACEMANCISI